MEFSSLYLLLYVSRRSVLHITQNFIVLYFPLFKLNVKTWQVIKCSKAIVTIRQKYVHTLNAAYLMKLEHRLHSRQTFVTSKRRSRSPEILICQTCQFVLFMLSIIVVRAHGRTNPKKRLESCFTFSSTVWLNYLYQIGRPRSSSWLNIDPVAYARCILS